MHDPRISTALRQLADLRCEPDPPRWSWTITRPDPQGRLHLPNDARGPLGVQAGRRHELRGIGRHLALVLNVDGDGVAVPVDTRGRLSLPMWLRRPPRPLLVGVDRDAHMVVVAPATVLDEIGCILSGVPR